MIDAQRSSDAHGAISLIVPILSKIDADAAAVIRRRGEKEMPRMSGDINAASVAI